MSQNDPVVVVFGPDANAVAETVAAYRAEGTSRVAGFVGDDEAAARAMGEDLFGRVDQTCSVQWGAG